MTIGLIIESTYIKNPELNQKNTTNGNIIFVVIDEECFKKLENLKIGEDRSTYINSSKFINNIIYYMYIQYNEKDNTIFLNNCDEKYIELLFKTFNLFFEDTLSIITLYKNNDKLIQHGFSDPIICHKNDICLIRPNSFIKDINAQSTRYEIEYLKTQINNDYCSIIINLDKYSIDYMKYLITGGVTLSDKKRSQKEYFGHFDIIKTELKKGSIIHTISLDKNTLVSGKDDEITIDKASLYNFHSHPFQAYLKYKTKYGIPSISDYKSVFIMSKHHNTIVHFVASLEGLYIISINPENKTLQLSDTHVNNFIQDNFNYKDEITDISHYIKFINDFRLFKLNLLKWDKISGHNISLKFNKVGKNCIIK